ncbi:MULTISPECIES: hypothetical protein [unclassified Rhizobium]|jgi:hypothetical protein|uniref:hypothetical protein n=1 Tax=unclassified Rhizobium TaxID=2613769 RepID=UPI003D2A1221
MYPPIDLREPWQLREFLMVRAGRYSHIEKTQRQLVDRTLASAFGDPDALGNGDLSQALFSLMHRLAQGEARLLTPRS